MSLLNKKDYNHVYICPNCGSRHINFSRERSIDGNAIVRCDDCGWSHREPNGLGYSNNQLYCQGVAAYNRPTGSEHIAYPDEKSERELLEDILAELNDIRKKLNDLHKHEIVYYQLRGGSGMSCSTCANYNSPIGQCERGVAGCKYEPDERERY
jgi:predicted RNA-binding Zn-ribbon protein involved in translation (DUF1610 family)